MKCPCRKYQDSLGYLCTGGFQADHPCELPMLTDYQCTWSQNYFTKERIQTIEQIMLHGLSFRAAKDLLARIESREIQHLLYIGENKNIRRTKYSPQLIHTLCRDLQDRPKISCATIARIHKVPRTLVHNLKLGKTRTEISSRYDFSERDKIWQRYNKKEEDYGNSKV